MRFGGCTGPTKNHQKDGEGRPPPSQGGTSRNGWQPTADALLTMERLRQPVAAGGNGFALFLRFTVPPALPLIALGCTHGAP